MDNHEARSILSAYRAGESLGGDARFEDALHEAERDPALAQWWDEEQELDRVIADKFQGGKIPAGLKARLLEPNLIHLPTRASWPRRIALLAASIVLLAVFFGSWRGLFQPANSLADYRDEMVSFVRLDPALDLKTAQLARVTEFLKERAAPNELEMPPGLQQMEPVGCRTLRYRGADVALVCFRRADGNLVHLFVIERPGMGKSLASRQEPKFAAAGEWMTASWTRGGHVYLLAAKGDHDAIAKYFGTS